MFGRKQAPVEASPPTAETTEATGSGKGRPTPSRKEAEAARKQSLRVPKDPKAAKKAARERDREARSQQRAALMAGDERVGGHAPLVVDHREIRVADAAGLDAQLDLFGPERPGGVFEGLEFAAGFHGGPCVNGFGHGWFVHPIRVESKPRLWLNLQ